MAEWLANLKIQYVIGAVLVLLVVRLVLARRKTPVAKSIGEVVEAALIAIVLVFLVIRPFFVQAFFIPSESMLPTLRVHDHILVNKLVYRIREPKTGEIVVFKAPLSVSVDGTEKDYIKRLVALPGDVVEVKQGRLYRNGMRLDEPYLKEQFMKYEMKPTTIPDEKLFVLGDNRNNSNDSHAWGVLDRDRIIGKAMFIFWPPKRIGSIDRKSDDGSN